MHDKLVAKVNNIDISGFVLKTKYNPDKSELVEKFLILTDVLEKTDYNAETSEIECKIPSICSLVTTSALTAVENKISNVSNLVKKTDYDTKISKIRRKLLIMIIINILLPQNSISLQQKFLLQD